MVNRTADRPDMLTSNGLPIPFTEELLAPLPDSTDRLGEPEALQAVLREQSVVLLRGLLDPAEVWRLRGEYFSLFPESYLEPGTEPADGIFSGVAVDGLPPHGMPGHPAYDFVRGDTFARFVERQPLRDLAGILLGGQVKRLPRVILRHFDHQSGRSSRAHTDYAYMDRGSTSVVTMWLPIGDCPVESGGLVYLEGSHRIPPDRLSDARKVTDRPGDERPISHDLAWVARELDRPWLWADYRAGDVVVHSPHIVHASLDTSTKAMRMSVDIRFVAAQDTPDDRWLRPWSADDGA
jgi:hypothetical protein